LQEKAIVLKKCKGHRIGIVAFSVAMLAVLTFCVIALRSAAAILLYIPILVILGPLTLYYLSWNIRFEEKVIVKRVFFREINRFSYSMLREVVKRYYTSERNFTICMHFVNGKTLQFRMDDENAGKATKKLQKYCSIKTP
jgi:hypothetical protein